jgi:hypothetical protein
LSLRAWVFSVSDHACAHLTVRRSRGETFGRSVNGHPGTAPNTLAGITAERVNVSECSERTNVTVHAVSGLHRPTLVRR